MTHTASKPVAILVFGRERATFFWLDYFMKERTFRPPLGQGCFGFRAWWPLQRASDLSTRRQPKGHAMVTTGTED